MFRLSSFKIRPFVCNNPKDKRKVYSDTSDYTFTFLSSVQTLCNNFVHEKAVAKQLPGILEKYNIFY